MKKLFSTYGNCQSHVISELLMKHECFSSNYELNFIKPIQTIKSSEVEEILNLIARNDLLIHQVISDSYRINDLGTNNIQQMLPYGADTLTIPSVYFDGYSPHSAPFMGIKSILDHTHDYFIIHSYIKGLSVSECVDLITDEGLYSKESSAILVQSSLQELKKREVNLDIKLSDFIEENYTKFKLFHQFNHPNGLLIQVLVNKILDKLGFEIKQKELMNNNIVLGALKIPVYISTHKNLQLDFEENFHTFGTLEGAMNIENVVENFYDCYKNLNKTQMFDNAALSKPAIIDIFNSFI